MKSLIFKCLVILLLLLVIDCVFGLLMDGLYQRLPESDSTVSVVQRSLNKECSVLILGPSSAKHNYNTEVIAEELGKDIGDIYNAGMDGRDIVYADIVYQSICEKCYLESVLLDIGYSNMDGSWLNRLDCLKPQYGHNKHVTSFFNNEAGWQQWFKLHSNIYRYNSTFLDFVYSILNEKTDLNQGFTPLFETAENLSFDTVNTYSIDSVEYTHLCNIVESTQKRGIQLLIVKSPHEHHNPKYDEWLIDFCKKNGVKVAMENNNEYYYQHPELMRDECHLNNEGSVYFSKNICKQIKNNNNERD